MIKARKRKPAFDPQQGDFFAARPTEVGSDGALADLDRVIASVVATVLKDDPRSRYDVAGAVSAIVDTDVSKAMLDAYSSEARDGHNISAGRFLALIVVTRRFDLLCQVLWRIGCTLLVGEEIHLAEIGHLEAQRRQIEARLRVVKSAAQPMTRGGARK